MTRTSESARARRAFTLVEMLAALVVSALLLAMLAIAGGESRRLARLGEDIAKLGRIGGWSASYCTDNQDLFWSFSWKKNVQYSPNIPPAPSDLQAAANQAVDILHRVAGRQDIVIPTGWIPHVLYNHLVLADYAGPHMPDLTFVSAADKQRTKWARDPYGFDAGLYPPAPPGVPGDPATKRWPYSSSFQVPPAFYDQSPVGSRLSQGAAQNTYTIPASVVLGGHPISSIAFPSAKVLMHDQFAWHFGPRVSYAALPELRLPLLFADGGVVVRASAECNPGWQPNSPTISTSTTFNYQPSAWEPPTLTGTPSQLVPAGRFRWTRGGVAGRDYGGPEVCTGQPGCP